MLTRTARRLILLLVLLLALGTTACGTGGASDWSAESLGREAAGQPLTVIVANSGGSLAIGPNRLSIALFDREGRMVHDAESVTARLFRLDGDAGTLAEEVTLTRSQLIDEDHRQQHERERRGQLLPGEGPLLVSADPFRVPAGSRSPGHEDTIATLYVANLEFDRDDWWGVAVSATRGGEREGGLRTRLFVYERSVGPMIGSTVPRSLQQTLRDVADISAIDSGTTPDPELHTETVKEAVEAGQPVIIAIATPRFCQTRYCGPVLDQAVLPIWQQYRGRIRVLHVEPWDLPQANTGRLVPVPMMAEWGLRSEPVVFVLDRDGRLAAKFEGVVTASELAAVLDKLLTR